MPTAKHAVCLIDDDKIYQFTARKILESTGLAKSIVSFFNGSEAIGFLKENAQNADQLPDVVFLDINMPVMNGWEFLDEFQQLRPSMKKSILIYMVSSSVDDTDIQKSRSYQEVKDYIVKPINRQRYQELMERMAG
ncbi:MAG: response regulator [Sphingobacteriia bacterium]|nr:MAG: response regulator [Sphingobacteriia bacterium]